MSVLIVGSGVVGQATGVGLRQIGHRVVFVDTSEDRLSVLRNEGLSAVHLNEMSFTGVGTIFVAVPTPSTVDGIDLTCLDTACKAIGVELAQTSGHPLIVVRSTIPPGTTRHRVIPKLESVSGLRHGRDFLVAYNPEYLRAASAVTDFLAFRMVTIGAAERTDPAHTRLREVFVNADATFMDLTFEEAEFQKYVHNLFNATKISFFNEMRQAGEMLGIRDIDTTFALTTETAEALWNPEYGIRDHGPFSGACLPKDTLAWLVYAKQRNVPSQMVRAALAVNTVQRERQS